MPNSQSYLAYPDVKEAFDRAMLGKGIRLTFPSAKAAHRFAARCSSWRLLDRKENMRLYEEGQTMWGRSAYDVLRITQEGPSVKIAPIAIEALSVEDLE